MCLIYYRDSARHTAKINFEALANAYRSNPDGTGLAWFNTKANQWSVWRSVSASWKQCRKRIAALDACENVSRMVLHFRFATHGGASLENCHPFQVAENSLFFHNGIFSGIDTDKDDKSDSRQVAEAMAKLVASGSKIRDAWRPIKLLAGSNRLLLTLPSGKVAYAGQWSVRDDGCYSNANCFPLPKATYSWKDYCNKDRIVGFSKYGSNSQKLLPYSRKDNYSTYETIRTIYDEYESDCYSQGDDEFLREFQERISRDDTDCDNDTQLEST